MIHTGACDAYDHGSRDQALDRQAQSRTGVEIIQGKTTATEASRSFDLTPSEVEKWVDEASADAHPGVWWREPFHDPGGTQSAMCVAGCVTVGAFGNDRQHRIIQAAVIKHRQGCMTDKLYHTGPAGF